MLDNLADKKFEEWDKDPNNPYHYHDDVPSHEWTGECDREECECTGVYENVDEIETAFKAGFEYGSKELLNALTDIYKCNGDVWIAELLKKYGWENNWSRLNGFEDPTDEETADPV